MSDLKFVIDTSDFAVLNEYLSTTTEKVEFSAERSRKAYLGIKSAVDPAFRASEMYKDMVVKLQMAVATGAIGNDQYKETFRQLQKQAKMAGVAINNFGRVASVNVRRFKRFGAVGMQQVGYQVGDFAVQVQGGTNALVALGQQGSQLLGIFGPYGAVAGALLAVVTSIAMVKNQTSEMTFEFKRFISDVADRSPILKKAWGWIVTYLKWVGNFWISYINAMINSVQVLTAVIKAIPQEVRNAFTFFQMKLNALGLQFKAVGYEAQAMAQMIKDALSPTGPAPGFLGTIPGEDPTTKVEDLKFLAEAARNQAEVLSDIAKEKYDLGVAAADLIQELDLIDIRDYFKQVAKESEGATNKLTAMQEKMNDLAKTIKDAMSDSLHSMVDGTKTVGEAFKDMARTIIKKLYDILVVQRLVGNYEIAAGGKVTSSGLVGAIMKGVSKSNFFGGFMASGGAVSAGTPYIVGERGPELMVPTTSGKIVPNNKMGGGQAVQISNNYTFTGGVTAADLQNMLPKIVEATNARMVDSIQRGGAVSKVW